MTPLAAPIDRKIAREAASWFLRLQAPTATAQEHQACVEWRELHLDHERAWQLATRFHAQLQAIPPAIGKSALRRTEPLGRRAALKALTSMVVLGSLGVAASRHPTVAGLTADTRTGVGELREVTLPDGTHVHLNTDSAIDIRFSRHERTLIMRKGEIYVTTAVDIEGQNRPFVVESDRGYFRPLGTQFSIRRKDDFDDLTVTQGTVEVTPRLAPTDTLAVGAGQRAALTGGSVKLLPGSVIAVDWISGVLRVERMHLADFANELGRYRHGWIRCAPEVAQLQVSGTFQLRDTDNALAAVALVLPIKIRYITRYWVTLDLA